VDLPDFRVDRGEDRAEEGEVRAPIMFEKRSQVDMLSLVRSVPPRGLSSRGEISLHHIRSRENQIDGVFRLVQRVSRKLSVSLQIS